MDQRSIENFFRGAPLQRLKEEQIFGGIKVLAEEADTYFEAEWFADMKELRRKTNKNPISDIERKADFSIFSREGSDLENTPQSKQFVGYHRLFFKHPYSDTIQKNILRIREFGTLGYSFTVYGQDSPVEGNLSITPQHIYLFSRLPSQSDGYDYELMILQRKSSSGLMCGVAAKGALYPSAYRVITQKIQNDACTDDVPEQASTITSSDKSNNYNFSYEQFMYVLDTAKHTVGERDSHVLANLQWTMEKLNEPAGHLAKT